MTKGHMGANMGSKNLLVLDSHFSDWVHFKHRSSQPSCNRFKGG